LLLRKREILIKKIEFLYIVVQGFWSYLGGKTFNLFIRYSLLHVPFRVYYSLPFIQKKYVKSPYKNYIRKLIKAGFLGKNSIYHVRVGGMSMVNLHFFLISCYYFFKNHFFPDFQVDFAIILFAPLPFVFYVEYLFSWKDDKGEKMIERFSKEKRWWKIRWGLYSFISPFFFMVLSIYL